MSFPLKNRAGEPNPNWQQRMRTVSHHITWQLGRRWPRIFPLVFVLGYPKSGTTWTCQVVADYLRLPFPQHSLLPVGCPAVVHGHEPPDSRYPLVVYSVRDGRDALISMYFFLLRGVSGRGRVRLPSHLRAFFPAEIDRDDVAGNIAPFVERQMVKPADGCNWGQHVRAHFGSRREGHVMLRYEDLLADGPNSLAAAMSALSSEEPDTERAQMALQKYSFGRLADRKPGTEIRDSFLRKGTAGDWKTHFTREAAEIFDYHCGDMLIAAGYEPDRSWLEKVPPSRETTCGRS